MSPGRPPRLLTIMGSGETAPTMVKAHRNVVERLGAAAGPGVLLDTPFGFQRNADELCARAVAYFRAKHDVIDVDGVRVLFGDGWGLIRASNTQPVIVARYEAANEQRLAAIRGEMEGWLRGQGVRV